MREIKFRGQRADNNEWVYGYYVYGQIHIQPSSTDEWWGYEVKPETVGQFTGFKDKNGVEIYEGDILTDSLNMFVRGVNYVITSSRVGFDICNHEDYIVIGNIHENKELLTNKP